MLIKVQTKIISLLHLFGCFDFWPEMHHHYLFAASILSSGHSLYRYPKMQFLLHSDCVYTLILESFVQNSALQLHAL